MDVKDYVVGLARKACVAAGELRKLSTDEKNALLLKIAETLEADREAIYAANATDVAAAQANGLSPAMVDRLTLTDARFKSMVDGVRYTGRHTGVLCYRKGDQTSFSTPGSELFADGVRIP